MTKTTDPTSYSSPNDARSPVRLVDSDHVPQSRKEAARATQSVVPGAKPFEIETITWQIERGCRWRRCSSCGGGKIHVPEFVAFRIDAVVRENVALVEDIHDSVLTARASALASVGSDLRLLADELRGICWSCSADRGRG